VGASAKLYRIDRYLVVGTGSATAWSLTLVATLTFAIVYFYAAHLSLALLAKPSNVAVFWPASGLAAGILITLGRRAGVAVVAGVLLGTIAANLLSDRTLTTSILKGVCNAGETVLVAWLLDRWFDRPFTFSDLRRVMGFFAAAGIAVSISAVGGAATMAKLHTAAPFWEIWLNWFLSDGLGVVVVAPLLIELGQLRYARPTRAQLIEGIGFAALMALVSVYAVSLPTGTWLSFDSDAIVFPILLWLTARNLRMFAIAGALLTSMAVIGATIYGIGHFGDANVPISERVLGAQVVAIMVTAFTLVLAGLFTRLRHSEELHARKSAALARLHDASSHLWRKRDLRQVLNEVLEGAIELLNADMGHIQVLQPARGGLELASHRGIHQEVLDLIRDVSAVPYSACARALRSGQRTVVEDTETDPRYIPIRVVARKAGYRSVQSTPIMSSDGKPLGVLSTHCRLARRPAEEDLRLLDLYVRLAADIIERHEADTALRESEERLRLAQLKTGVGIWDWDVRTGRVTWSAQLAAIFGIEPGMVTSYSDFRERVHPDDIKTIENKRNAAVQRHEAFNFEFRIIRPDGQVRWIAAAGGALYDEKTGTPIRILGNNIDVTERKLAEQSLAERNAQFDLARKSARVGTYTYDNVAKTMQLSTASAAIFGLSESTFEITSADWHSRVHPQDRSRIAAERRHAFTEQRPELVGDFRIIRLSGEVRWIEARARVTYDDVGRASRMIGVYIDVTERRQAEDHKTLLIAELDHRVKNVLACVEAVAQRTRETAKTMDEFLSVLEGRIHSLANTHALLSRNRWHGVNLAELVRTELAPCKKDDNTHVEGPDIVLAAEAAQPVAMVIHELATNATKYGALSNGQGRVSVEWRCTHDGVAFIWSETGGPPIIDPPSFGYGTGVIRELIPYELAGSVNYVLARDGARCNVAIPAKWLSVPQATNATA
jgi:PAS domain S-box-containing protein